MLRLLTPVALCMLVGYTTVFLVPCLQAAPGPATAQAHVEHGSPPDPHAAHGSASGHAHGSAHAGHMGHAAPAESSPCEIGAVCPCGCESTPQAAPGMGRLPNGIAAAAPVLPSGPEGSPHPTVTVWLPCAPCASFDHVPIYS